MLRIAACLGDTNFSLSFLSRVMTLSHVEITNRLSPAEEIGFISSDQSYQVGHQRLMLILDAFDRNGLPSVK